MLGVLWPNSRVDDTPEQKDSGFIPYQGHRVVSLSKTHQLKEYRVISRKQWLSPDMTEKLLIGVLILNTNTLQSKSLNLPKQCNDDLGKNRLWHL